MVLIDTSVWIDHFRRTEAGVSRLLSDGLAVVHPFVLGEVALGLPGKATQQLSAMEALPWVVAARDSEVLRFIRARNLAGTGVGYVDAHLLAAVHLTPGTLIWSRDKRLTSLAERLRVSFTP